MKKFTKFIGLLLMGVFIMSGCGAESEDVAKTGSSDESGKETKTERLGKINTIKNSPNKIPTIIYISYI